MPRQIFGSTFGQKAIDIDTFFEYLAQHEGDTGTAALFKQVGWLFRCLRLRADALASIPYTIWDGETEVDWPIPLQRSLWSTEAFLCLYGASYWLKRENRVTVKEIQVLNSNVTKPVVDTVKGIIGFVQSGGGKEIKYKPDQIVYFRYWNPVDDLGPGVAPGQVVNTPANLVKNANTWASRFFLNGAIPAVLLSTEQTIQPKERKELESRWAKMLKGIQKAWKTIVLTRGLKADIIGMPVKDLAMPDLMLWTQKQIASAFGVPLAMLEENAANRATAEIHRLSFWTETMIPEAEQVQFDLNEQLFKALGLRFEFHFNMIEAIQKDEANKAKSVSLILSRVTDAFDKGIVSREEARTVLNQVLVQMALPELGENGPGKALWKELAQWKAKAQRTGSMDFEPKAIPQYLYDRILQVAVTQDPFTFLDRKLISGLPKEERVAAEALCFLAEECAG